MAKPKKNLKQVLEEELDEAITEAPSSVEEANNIQRDNLEARKIYLYHLREELTKEGIKDIGQLDVVLSKVLQEIESLK